MIPEKVTWVQFPAKINTVYGKLPPYNDLFLKILKQIFGMDFLAEYQIKIFFSAMLLHQNIVRQNKFFNSPPPPPQLFVFFLLIWLFQEQFHIRLYWQNCKLLIVNSQIKIFPKMLEAAEFWCSVGLTAVLCLLLKGKTLLFFNLYFFLLLTEP